MSSNNREMSKKRAPPAETQTSSTEIKITVPPTMHDRQTNKMMKNCTIGMISDRRQNKRGRKQRHLQKVPSTANSRFKTSQYAHTV